MWRASGKPYGKWSRQSWEGTEEGSNAFEILRIKIGSGGLEGLRLLIRFGRVFRGLKLSAPHGADGEVTIGAPWRSTA